MADKTEYRCPARDNDASLRAKKFMNGQDASPPSPHIPLSFLLSSSFFLPRFINNDRELTRSFHIPYITGSNHTSKLSILPFYFFPQCSPSWRNCLLLVALAFGFLYCRQTKKLLRLPLVLSLFLSLTILKIIAKKVRP